MARIISTKHIRARKSHECSECDNLIKPGQMYYSDSVGGFNWGETIQTVKTCTRCFRLKEFMTKNYGAYTFGLVRTQFNYVIEVRRNEKR